MGRGREGVRLTPLKRSVLLSGGLNMLVERWKGDDCCDCCWLGGWGG